MDAKDKINYITPPNFLKQKVGRGGLPKETIQNAEDYLNDNDIDFNPYIKNFLDFIDINIKKAHASKFRTHDHVTAITYPVMQLKAHGRMFGRPLITQIASSALSFLENIYILDDDALTVLEAHYDALEPVSKNKIRGLGGPKGDVLMQELNRVCDRYYKKYDVTPEH